MPNSAVSQIVRIATLRYWGGQNNEMAVHRSPRAATTHLQMAS